MQESHFSFLQGRMHLARSQNSRPQYLKKKMRETVKSSLSDCGRRGPEISEREKEETMWCGYGTCTVGLHIHSGTCSVI